MANVLRIKRSVSTNTPASLAQGELANSESASPNGINELFIGITGSSLVKIVQNLNAQPAQPTSGLTAATPVTADYAVFEDVTDSLPKRVLFSATPLSIFNNDSGWTANAGTVTSVVGGVGVSSSGGADPSIALTVDELAEKTGAVVGTDRLVGTTGTTNWAETISGIPLSIFSDDLGHVENATHTGQVTGSGALVLNPNALAITAQPASGAIVAADTILINDGGVLSEATFTQMVTFFDAALTFITAEADTLADVTGRGASTATASTFSGGILMSDSDLNRPVLEDYGIKHTAPTVSANAVTLDCAVSNSFLVDMDPATAAVVVTLSNPSPSGTYCEMTIAVVMGTPAYGITWPGTVTWQGGTAPALTTVDNNVDLVHLFTVDGGTNWYGTFSISDASAGGGTVTAVTGAYGITSTGGATPAIALALTELTVVTGVAADWIAIEDATDNSTKKALISGISVGAFNNATTEYVSENDTLVVADWNWVLDEDLMGTDSAVHLATQQSIKAYVDTAVTGALTHKGGYNAATNSPPLDTGSPVLEIGDMYTVTAAGTFFTVVLEIGDVLIADVDSVDAAAIGDWTIVQSNIGAASETVAGYIEIATQAEVDLLTGGSALLAVVPAYLHLTTFDGGTF